jgi:hypothetical protein
VLCCPPLLSAPQIASHPEVQAKIAAELDTMGLLVTPQRPVPRDMVLEDLRQLPYLTACVKEGAYQAAARTPQQQ